MKKKIRVAVLYGGRSGEHEVSLQSGAAVIENLNRDLYEVIPISIDKTGRWQWNDLRLIEESRSKALPIYKNAPEMRLQAHNNGKASLESISGSQSLKDIDVFFPVIHGPLCEDGTVQGLLELAEVAYVGSGVLGSAIGMDKDVSKRLAAANGIPVAPYLCVKKNNFQLAKVLEQSKKILTLPVFVKPANMGSSVGIHKVKKWEDLGAAIEDAFLYDVKILIEQGIEAREIEVAVLESLDGKEPIVSVPSEIQASGGHEFYSYEAKYLDENGARVELPAKISQEQTKLAQTWASKIFDSLELSGMARVDLFLDKNNGKFYFNEVNTIPGFTSISMYPKMMEASGIPYAELLHRLVQLAMDKHEKKMDLKREK